LGVGLGPGIGQGTVRDPSGSERGARLGGKAPEPRRALSTPDAEEGGVRPQRAERQRLETQALRRRDCRIRAEDGYRPSRGVAPYELK